MKGLLEGGEAGPDDGTGLAYHLNKLEACSLPGAKELKGQVAAQAGECGDQDGTAQAQ